MRALVPFHAALLVSFALGCTSTRELTPWLRTSSTTHYERGFIAESGGSGPYTTGSVERLEDGEWVTLSGWDSMAGFGFAGNTRAVVGNTLVPEKGAPLRIPCRDHLRGAPNDVELYCVVTYTPAEGDLPTDLVHVERFDRDGSPIDKRVVDPPLRRPPGSSVWESYDTTFLGFLAPGLLFSVYHDRADEPLVPGRMGQCEGYLLHPDNHWELRGVLHFDEGSVGDCNSPEAWIAQLGWPLDPGKRPLLP